jgi:hypothetical protein
MGAAVTKVSLGEEQTLAAVARPLPTLCHAGPSRTTPEIPKVLDLNRQ